MMKRVRKGFTLVELLIVIAVLGSLGAMMSYSSSGAVDSADAAKIISNLQTLKMAAMQMYIEEPKVASLTAIALDGSTTITISGTGESAVTKTVAEILGSYLGKKSNALTTSKYGLIGNATSWYVVYALDAADSAGVKAKLAAQADATDLFAWTSAAIPDSEASYYTVADTNTHIAMKVR